MDLIIKGFWERKGRRLFYIVTGTRSDPTNSKIFVEYEDGDGTYTKELSDFLKQYKLKGAVTYRHRRETNDDT